MTRKLFAEALGSALLLAIVVGSGVMGASLSGGNDAIALLGNTLATGAGLTVLRLEEEAMRRALMTAYAGSIAPGLDADLARLLARRTKVRWVGGVARCWGSPKNWRKLTTISGSPKMISTRSNAWRNRRRNRSDPWGTMLLWPA